MDRIWGRLAHSVRCRGDDLARDSEGIAAPCGSVIECQAVGRRRPERRSPVTASRPRRIHSLPDAAS
jgi:hypothetical protein